MNNTWSGIERSAYDRRELVMDMDELMAKSKAGEIIPWVPGESADGEQPAGQAAGEIVRATS